MNCLEPQKALPAILTLLLAACGWESDVLHARYATAADIQRDQQECACGDDPHPEHYRWRAFSSFLSAQRTVSPELACELYALAAADPDREMGGSMMAAVLRHHNCPADLLRSALTSDRPHLQRLAAQRLTSNERNS